MDFKEYKPLHKKDSSILLFKDLDRDDVEDVLNTKKEKAGDDNLSNDGSFSGNELNNSFEDSDGSKGSDEESSDYPNHQHKPKMNRHDEENDK